MPLNVSHITALPPQDFKLPSTSEVVVIDGNCKKNDSGMKDWRRIITEESSMEDEEVLKTNNREEYYTHEVARRQVTNKNTLDSNDDMNVSFAGSWDLPENISPETQ